MKSCINKIRPGDKLYISGFANPWIAASGVISKGTGEYPYAGYDYVHLEGGGYLYPHRLSRIVKAKV